jgi:hypothetical protein
MIIDKVCRLAISTFVKKAQKISSADHSTEARRVNFPHGYAFPAPDPCFSCLVDGPNQI